MYDARTSFASMYEGYQKWKEFDEKQVLCMRESLDLILRFENSFPKRVKS